MSCITELYWNYYLNKTKIIKSAVCIDFLPVALAHLTTEIGIFNGIIFFYFSLIFIA